MTAPNADERLELLLEALSDGQLDEAGRHELLRLLDDPARRRALWRHGMLTGALISEFSASTAVAEDAPAHLKPWGRQGRRLQRRDRPRPGIRRWMPWAVAAVLLLTVGVIAWPSRRPSGPAAIAVMQVVAPGTQINRDGQAVAAQAGMALQAHDRIRIDAAASRVATVAYPDQSRLEILAGTQVELWEDDDAKRVGLDQGAVRGDIAHQPSGKSMRLQTSLAEAEVVGTRFLLRADPAMTRLEVQDGEIAFRRHDGSTERVRAGAVAEAHATPVATAPATPTSLAQRHPGDAGMAQDPAVIFSDDFESGGFGRWDDWDRNPAPDNQIVSDPQLVHSGARAAQLLLTRPDKTVDLVKWFDRGYDRVYARWYCRFAADYAPGPSAPGAPGSDLNGGSLVATRERSQLGTNNSAPDGSNFFTTLLWANPDLGRNPLPGLLALRAQRPGMRPDANDDPWWGVFSAPDRPRRPICGQWHCLGLLLAANTPGRNDGEQAFWLDGELCLQETGLRWRDQADLRINGFWLPFALRDCPRPTSIAIDDVVIATEYVGPMTGTRPGQGP